MKRTMIVGALVMAVSSPAYANTWGPPSAGPCNNDTGTRVYSAILWDIPWYENWDAACRSTGAFFLGANQGTPDRCIENVWQWGEWDIADPACVLPTSCAAANVCGRQAADGCWCDDACERFGDCCADKVDYCG